MLLLTVPSAIAALVGLLALASSLEQRRVRSFVRMTVRSNASPEQIETLIALELEPVLTAAGLSNRFVTPR